MNRNLSLSQFAGWFKRSNTLVFWIGLLVILVLEGFVLNHSVSIMVSVRNAPPAPLPNRSVRINFTAYDQILKRIEGAQQNSVPVPVEPVNNPFQSGGGAG